MSDQSFDIDVDPVLRTDLVLDLPGDDWNPAVVVPALTALSDRMPSQPHLDGVFRLVVLRGGRLVFDSSHQPLEMGSGPDTILRGTVPHSGRNELSESHAGMTLVVASAGTIEKESVRRSPWPVLLWLVGQDANEVYFRVHRALGPMRTVADPSDASDRLTLVCSRFLNEVATADQPDVTRWIDDRVSPITEGMGYAAG
ncbi:hypothetical protein [Rhodococcus sp. CH91]|uniref:hypothetical protein n=1 Tax=Rhodococcus sp. CH91 TaxID=2910256 RepID=UPI001F4A356D|nr:hypothetical protein [Rhodococcus sp. CH91]